MGWLTCIFLIFKGKKNLWMLMLHLFTVQRDFFHVGMGNVFHVINFVILSLTAQTTMMKANAVSGNFEIYVFKLLWLCSFVLFAMLSWLRKSWNLIKSKSSREIVTSLWFCSVIFPLLVSVATTSLLALKPEEETLINYLVEDAP